MSHIGLQQTIDKNEMNNIRYSLRMPWEPIADNTRNLEMTKVLLLNT